MNLPDIFIRYLVALGLYLFMGMFSAQADAATPDPRLFGPWTVEQSVSRDNIGLQVYFSPDGNFFMVDQKTQIGLAGSWVMGRAGLLVSIYGNGKWAKLWDADITFESNDRMVVDVKESQVATPQRFTLGRLKF